MSEERDNWLTKEVDRVNKFHAERAAAYAGGPKLFNHNGKDREAAYPWLDDIEMAGMVRMLGRYDINHEGVVCAARDRILHLSQRLAYVLFQVGTLEAENAELKAAIALKNQQDEEDAKRGFWCRLFTLVRTGR